MLKLSDNCILSSWQSNLGGAIRRTLQLNSESTSLFEIPLFNWVSVHYSFINEDIIHDDDWQILEDLQDNLEIKKSLSEKCFGQLVYLPYFGGKFEFMQDIYYSNIKNYFSDLELAKQEVDKFVIKNFKLSSFF